MIIPTLTSPHLRSEKSLVIWFKSEPGIDIIENYLLVELCHSGPLKSLLQQAFPSETAFTAAWQASNGEIKNPFGLSGRASRQPAPAPTIRWSLNYDGLPQLKVEDSAENDCQIMIRVA